MNAFKLILYPYAGAFAALGITMLLGTAAFGTDLKHWAQWQNQLVSTNGTILGILGAFIGAWLAVRPTGRASS